MKRAISMVSRSFHNFQPNRSASLPAISLAPLPYSRSIVRMRVIVLPLSAARAWLTDRDASACPGIVPANNKGKHEHYTRRDGEHHIRIDVGEGLRLCLERLVDEPVGDVRGVRGTGPTGHQLAADSTDLILKILVESGGVVRQGRLMKLLAPRQ